MSGYGSPMGGGQGGDGGSGGQQRRQQAPSEDYSMRKELEWVKADMALIRNAVVLLEQEKDHLRQAVRKLKMENQRVKEKLTRVQGEVRALKGDDGCDGAGAGEDDDEEWNHTDYDEIGRHFLLVGGAQDPLSLRFEAAIRDDQGVEHRSAERYYWYKMAEYFGDRDTMAAVLAAPTTQKAEEAMSACKGFDEKKWDEPPKRLPQYGAPPRILAESRIHNAPPTKPTEGKKIPSLLDVLIEKPMRRIAQLERVLDEREKVRGRREQWTEQPQGGRAQRGRRVWLIRHGERVDNVDKRWRDGRADWDDAPLSARGTQQAEQLRRRFEMEGGVHVLTSPFRRCVDTAVAVFGAGVKVEPGFGEVGWACGGGWKQPSGRMIDPHWPGVGVWPGREERAEGDAACFARVDATLRGVMNTLRGDMAIVTHGAVASAIHACLGRGAMEIGQACVSMFEWQGEGRRWVEKLAGDSSHLAQRHGLRVGR